MTKKILIALLLVLLSVSASPAQDDDFWYGVHFLDTADDHWYDHEGTGLPSACGHEYWTHEALIFEWDPLPGTDYYEIKLLWLDPEPDREINVGYTIFTDITIPRPRSGHFFFAVRACNASGCGVWSSSNDETVSTVDDEPRRWRVYFTLPPPSDIIIE